jgi:uncharacterized membrane protein
MDKQNRLKSKVVWSTVAGLILMIIGELGLWDKIGIQQDNIRYIIDSTLTILVLFGILNNPTEKGSF